MKILNENISKNIMNKLNESYDVNDIVRNIITMYAKDYGVKGVEGKDNKILVKTDNGDYWVVIAGDKIKISIAKDSAQPIVRTNRGKISVPRTIWEVEGVLNNPEKAAIDALKTLEPAPKEQFVVALGDEYFGGFDENNQVFLVGSVHSAQHFESREQAEHVASQFENGEIEEI